MTKALILIFNIFLGLGFYLLGDFPWRLVFLWYLSSFFWLVLVKEKLNFRRAFLLDIAIAFLLFVVALMPRIYKLSDLPFGLWGDEAEFANMAQLLVKSGKFLPIFDQTPAYYLYGIALFNSLFGKTAFSTRLFPAIVGALNSSILFFILREKLGRFISIIGSFLFAFSYWNLIFSRLAFEHTMYLFFVLLGLWGVIRLVNNRNNSLLLLTLGLGMGLSSYAAFRVLMIGYIAFLTYYCLNPYKQLKLHKKGFLILIIGIFIINLPLWALILKNPQDFFGHTDTLSIFNIPVPLLIKIQEILVNTLKNLGLIFGILGDFNPRHNPAQTVMVNPLVTILFIVGFIIIWKRDKLLTVFLSLMFFLSLVPATLSFEGLGGFNQPHAGRTISALPIIYIFASFALGFIHQRYKTKFNTGLLLVFLVIVVAFIDLSSYFNQKQTFRLSQAYDVTYTETAKLGKKYIERGYKVYLPAKLAAVHQIDFFMPDKNYQIWSGDLKAMGRRSVLILNLYQDQDLIKNEILAKQNEWPTVPKYLDSENSSRPDIMIFQLD